MKSSISNARRRERGMTLAEALIAVLVFAVVFLAALMLYNTANRAYIATDSATVQQQNARFAMDRLVQTIENGGAFYNVTGSNTIPDEQIEDADQAVVFVRGDYNNSRETSLQNTAHPYVTVGNSEIVGYILRKPGGDANNTVNITMHFDTTTASPGRDATISGATISNEETVSVRAAAQDLADETNPPYQLTRVTFDDSGNPVYEVVADNIFRLSFDYTKKDGTALATTAMGGEDAQRADRALIRKINVNLISMSDRPDFRYTDSTVYSPVEGTTTKRYRKFALNEYVNANLR
jgi:Tfp pilus assembly protein PilW